MYLIVYLERRGRWFTKNNEARSVVFYSTDGIIDFSKDTHDVRDFYGSTDEDTKNTICFLRLLRLLSEYFNYNCIILDVAFTLKSNAYMQVKNDGFNVTRKIKLLSFLECQRFFLIFMKHIFDIRKINNFIK